MMQEIFCSKCGTRNTGAGEYCQKCGALLSPVPTARPVPMAAVAYAPPVVNAFATPSPYAGFWIRLLAHIIDHVVLGCVALPLYFIIMGPAIVTIVRESRNGEPSPHAIVGMIVAVSIFVLVVITGSWLYEAILTSSSWQGTVGKRLLRLKVTDQAGNPIGFGRSTGRFFAKILSQIILWIGFIMIAFTDRKRGLHDMICGTLVMKY
jgi:uncharacterized RDD family membrane protein YckC